MGTIAARDCLRVARLQVGKQALGRVGVIRTKGHPGRRALAIADLAYNAGVDRERMAAIPARQASVTYVVGDTVRAAASDPARAPEETRQLIQAVQVALLQRWAEAKAREEAETFVEVPVLALQGLRLVAGGRR